MTVQDPYPALLELTNNSIEGEEGDLVEEFFKGGGQVNHIINILLLREGKVSIYC